jgi:hypothetical protein
MKLALSASLIASAAAFAPSKTVSTFVPRSLLGSARTGHSFMSNIYAVTLRAITNGPFYLSLIICISTTCFCLYSQAQTNTQLNSLNGWTPDANAFAYGLPGSTGPIENFDPLGFAKDASLEKIKGFREAELQHGRVAMLAVLGLLVTEEPIELHPLFEAYNKDIGPSIRHLDEVRAVSPVFFELLAVIIGGLELNRAVRGWSDVGTAFSTDRILKDDYYPGDIGFDPLGLKPDDADAFEAIQTKEINNGRLAMIGGA